MSVQENPEVRRDANVRAGLALVTFTMLYMVGETAIALWAGLRAHSVALESFGLDSVIEFGLAAVLFWRLSIEARGSEGERLERAERRASWWAGVAFYALAAFIVIDTGFALRSHAIAHPGFLGLSLAVAALIVMPALAVMKRRVGRAIGSRALVAEAECSMVCAYMSATLLVGLLATRFLGWWWADPLAALLLLYWVVREGRENFETAAGRECSCH